MRIDEPAIAMRWQITRATGRGSLNGASEWPGEAEERSRAMQDLARSGAGPAGKRGSPLGFWTLRHGGEAAKTKIVD